MKSQSLFAFVCVCALADSAWAQGPCTWVEPREKAKITPADGVVVFEWKLNPTWFKCAKKAGGTLSLEFLTGSNKKLKADKIEKISGASIRKGLYRNKYCGRTPPAQQVQVRLTGTGPMQRLSWTSKIIDVYCPRCEHYSSDTGLGLVWNPHANSKTFTINVFWVRKWYACAKKGSKAEVRIFLGDSKDEAMQATEPVHVVKGVEKKLSFKKEISKKMLCKHQKKFVAYELFATGEMQRVNGSGRSVKAIVCH